MSRWLPDCASCHHPFASHTIGTTQPPVESACEDCAPGDCDYVYTHPACYLCAEPVVEDYWVREGHVWHRECWRTQTRAADELDPVLQRLAAR